MIIVSPSIIKLYSQCPKKVFFCKYKVEEQQLSIHANIVKTVIKDYYQLMARKGLEPTWKLVISWVEKNIQKYFSKQLPQQAYKESTNILECLYDWQQTVLPYFRDPGIINFPIDICLDQSIVFKDTIDLITVSPKKVYFWGFFESKTKEINLYDNIEIQSKIWGFTRGFETQDSEFVMLIILPKTVHISVVRVLPFLEKKNEAIMRHILRGIKDRIFYPSYSEQCNTCEFKGACHY